MAVVAILVSRVGEVCPLDNELGGAAAERVFERMAEVGWRVYRVDPRIAPAVLETERKAVARLRR